MNPSDAPQRSSIRVSLTVPFRSVEVADYLFRPEVLVYWLGKDSVLQPEPAALARLPHATVVGRGIEYSEPLSGKVSSLAWPAVEKDAAKESATGKGQTSSGARFELLVTLDPPFANRRIRFSLTPRSRQSTRISIVLSGLANCAEAHAGVKAWQSALNRIARLMARAEQVRRRERQAVIVVHGIGEQRPGQLLRQFVLNVFDRDGGELHHVKPDYVSTLFEMRMATVPRNEGTRPTTDVYELYWAHLIRDTTVAQVYGWIFRLATSPKDKIPRTLINWVWALRASIVAALLAFAWLMTQDLPGWLTGLGLGSLAALPALLALGLKALRDHFIVGYAGDAARYLEPRPENIARRQEIREAGMQLLDALHDKHRYSRIMVYGHSLGSVIAYDILSYAWAQRSRRHGAQSKTSSRALRALEDLLNPRAGAAAAVSADNVQPMQHAAWNEYRRNGFDWLVSDFVSAGSPLTHAQWLLNLDEKTQFAELVRDRSFPSCPPQTEAIKSPVPDEQRRAFTFTHAYVDEQNPAAKRSVQVPHHAGLFALTRWTNLYFPYSGLIDGDPIGGPLAHQFGTWVRDIRLDETKGFAHSRYTDRDLDPEAVLQVRAALHLPFQRPLAAYAPERLHPSVLE
ncbi:hypothetical protein LNV09_15815 [Paucibacter sp. B2R-40]|uniref:hypothetical protein n=1 Tax=Paucibacter sp. B2R-40 TaxID=2893554 RepID=UPI0021E47955|nr:hypothetical protein [Paucibacter sp. B2R-40]MCV2355611.1 hypothetical protein [Paucibacter sp. B2R-40]